MHGPSFSFVSLLAIFDFFLQINHFYYFTSLRGLQDVENHCARLRNIELKIGRKIPYGFLVSKETVVLRRWGRSKQKFGFIKRVDKG